MALSSAPRSAKVSARRAGPPLERACSRAFPMSMPPVPARAIGSSVAGLTSVWSVPVPSVHAPAT
jgi:hypothetical protein